MPLTKTSMNWNTNIEKGSAPKPPATVRASDMGMFHHRCGTAMMQKAPPQTIEFEKRAMN